MCSLSNAGTNTNPDRKALLEAGGNHFQWDSYQCILIQIYRLPEWEYTEVCLCSMKGLYKEGMMDTGGAVVFSVWHTFNFNQLRSLASVKKFF